MGKRVLSLGIVAVCLATLLPTSTLAATVPPGFSEALVANGLTGPTAMHIAPDGRIFVTEHGGDVRVIVDGVLQPTPFARLAVDSEAERGLLGITLDPNFPTSPYVYVYYTVPAGAGGVAHNRVSRLTAVGNEAAPGSEVVVMDLDPLSTTLHNAGALAFGPDGKLYIASGDNAMGAAAQSLNTRLGKLLRINADGSIPPDNPFYATASGLNRAIWAYGLRNPFKFAFNPGGPAPILLINDVGGSAYEEINAGVPGANYGYPDNEGPVTHPAYTSPLYAYDHGPNGGCAILGGAFYPPDGARFPASYRNTYFFADYCAGWIRRLDPATRTVSDFATGVGAAVDLRVFEGALYYLSMEHGAVYRIDYGSPLPAISQHPQNAVVAPNQPATFTVTASGTAPFAYQWQRNGVNIPGATGASYTVGLPQLADSGARFRVRVSNSGGSVTSRDAVLTVTLNQAPVATITQPVIGARYSAGTTIAFAGVGTDAEDGALPPGAFTWRIDFHHDTHAHPFMPATSGIASGSFVVPTAGETAANVWYRIYLRVTDSLGRSHITVRDVHPHVARLAIQTSPPGLLVRLDSQPVRTPYALDSVVGLVRTLEAPNQSLNGIEYAFAGWSNGGSQAHAVSTPPVPTTYVAQFRPVNAEPPPAPAGFAIVANAQALLLTWQKSAGATSYRLEAGTASGLANLVVTDVGDRDWLQTLVPLGAYYARVRAVNAFGVSLPSNEVSVAVTVPGSCATAPPAPGNYAARAGGLMAGFTWAPSPGAAGYVLEAGTAPGRVDLGAAGVGNATSFATQAPAGTYFTRLRAVNACGVSPPTPEASITLACSPSAVVATGLTGVKSLEAVALSWQPAFGATSYRVRVGTEPGVANLADVDVGRQTTLTVSTAGVTGTYYVHVAAVSACGVGAPSHEVTLTLP